MTQDGEYMLKLIKYVLILSLIPVFYSCNKPIITELNYQERDYVIVTADSSYSLSLSNVYDLIYKSNYLKSGGVLDTTIIHSFVDSIIVDSLKGFEARSIDLSQHYNQYRIFKLRYYDYLIRQYLKKMVYDKVEAVDSLDIVEFYNSRPDLFTIDEQVNLYHIALTDNSLTNGPDSLRYRKLSKDELEIEMEKYADSVYSLITSKEIFPEIAKEYSEDEITAKSGGQIGWTKKNTHPHPFDSVAFSLEIGEIANPYQDRSGWHVIMIDGYYPEGVPPINENLYIAAERTMKTIQTNDIGQQLIDSLFAAMNVTINEELLDKDYFVEDGRIWAAIVNEIDTIDVNEARSMELSVRSKNNVSNSTSDMKRGMLQTIAEKYTLVQASRNIALEDELEIKTEKDKMWHKYARSVLKDSIYDPRWEPSDSMIEDYYNSNIQDFEVKKPLNVQHIIVEDSLLGEYIRDQALSGINFLDLADEYYPGEKSIRKELANLGFIGPEDVSTLFFQAAKKTRIGEVSHPVKTEFGYHIIKLIEIKENQDISKAKRPIIQKLKQKYLSDFEQSYRDKLYAKYHVEFVGPLKELHFKPKELRK